MGETFTLLAVDAVIPNDLLDAAFRRLKAVSRLIGIDATEYANAEQVIEAAGLNFQFRGGYEDGSGIKFECDYEGYGRKGTRRHDIIEALAPFIRPVIREHAEFVWYSDYYGHFMDKIEDGIVVRYFGELTVDPWQSGSSRTKIAEWLDVERERREVEGLPDIEADPQLTLGPIVARGTTEDGLEWESDGSLTRIIISGDESIIVNSPYQ